MKRLLLAIYGLLVFHTVYAQDSMPFLRIDRNPVSISMGETVAVSPIFNPSVSAQKNNSNVMVSYSLWSPGKLKQNLIQSLGYFKIGNALSVNYMIADDILPSYMITDDAGNETGNKFTPSNFIASIGVGYSINQFLSIGATFNFANQKTTEKNSYSSFSTNLFVNYTIKDFSATLGVVDLGPAVDGKYSLPTSVKAGALYETNLGFNQLNTTLDFDYYFNGGISVGLGTEFILNGLYYFRAGGRLSSKNALIPSNLTTGLGIKLSKINIDLSYIFLNRIIGNSLSLGISYSF